MSRTWDDPATGAITPVEAVWKDPETAPGWTAALPRVELTADVDRAGRTRRHLMTETTLQAPTGLVTHDLEGHDNVYPKEPTMELAGPDAGWGFHERAETLNGRLAMLGFMAAIATELISGEGLLRTIGL